MVHIFLLFLYVVSRAAKMWSACESLRICWRTTDINNNINHKQHAFVALLPSFFSRSLLSLSSNTIIISNYYKAAPMNYQTSLHLPCVSLFFSVTQRYPDANPTELATWLVLSTKHDTLLCVPVQ